MSALATPKIPADFVVRSKRVAAHSVRNELVSASIHIQAGVITAIADYDEIPPGSRVHDAGELVVMPGLVDTHVHVNEPGRTEWEGFSAATRGAAAGGVTTIVDMPLNSVPPTTTIAGLRDKIAAAAGQLFVDAGFWGGVVPGNKSEIRALWDAGAFGFKCFLVPSGVEEFPQVTESDLREALPELVSAGAVLLVHAETPGAIERAARTTSGAPPRHYSTWLASRPRDAENEAVAFVIRLAQEFGARVHIVHVSSAKAIPLLRRAKEQGVRITAETCPHYLAITAEEIPDGATEFKCAPPIRDRSNSEKLWAALDEGVIDMVVSDHSPCPPEMKHRDAGDFTQAWGGISSLQLSLPVMWTAMSERGISIPRMAEWMCAAPARIAGLESRKGTIAAGRDADLVIWNPDTKFSVESSALFHRHKTTPYAHRHLAGVVESVFLRGRMIFNRGEFSEGPTGRILRRTDR